MSFFIFTLFTDDYRFSDRRATYVIINFFLVRPFQTTRQMIFIGTCTQMGSSSDKDCSTRDVKYITVWQQLFGRVFDFFSEIHSRHRQTQTDETSVRFTPPARSLILDVRTSKHCSRGVMSVALMGRTIHLLPINVGSIHLSCLKCLHASAKCRRRNPKTACPFIWRSYHDEWT